MRHHGDDIVQQFPPNPFLQRLVRAALAYSISFEQSPAPEQWMYHPGRRAILVWMPDLRSQSMSYLVTIMAHELGHALHFDRHPRLARKLFSSASLELDWMVEREAFVEGFLLLKRLAIPVSLEQYLRMIEPPMASEVARSLNGCLCCLLDRYGAGYATSSAAAGPLPVALPPVA